MRRKSIPVIEFEDRRGRYLSDEANEALDKHISFLYKFFYIPHLNAFENCRYAIKGNVVIKYMED